MAVVLGDAVAYLVLDSTEFDSAIGKATSALSEFEATSAESWKALGSSISTLGASITRGISIPVAMAAKSVLSYGAEFEKQMSNVQSVSNATSDEMDQMEDAAIRWGEKTVYTATEAGDALYYMGLAGWDVQDSISALGPVLNLAAAGQLDLGRTSDIVTDAMTAMGMEADKTTNGLNNATYFTNTLAAAMSNSNTTVDMMGETFKYVAPLAGSLGFTIDDLALATGLMANVGVKASQAGTGLRQALKQLISPSKTAAAAMQKYDISLDDGTGNAKNFRQLMEELRSTFGGLNVDIYDASGELKTGEQIMEEYGDSLPLSQMEKLQAVTDIFGIRALPGMLGIIQQSDEKFNQLADAIDNSSQAFVAHGNEVYTMAEAYEKFGDKIYDTTEGFEILGAAEGMARMQMDNLAGDWTRLTSAFGTTKIILTKLVNEDLRAFVQALTKLVIWFNNLDESHQKIIVRIAEFVIVLGPVLTILGKLISTVGTIINLFSKFGGAIKAVQGLAAGFKGLYITIQNLGGVTKFLEAAFGTIGSQISGLITAIGGIGFAIGGIMLVFKAVRDAIEEGATFFHAVIAALGGALTGLGLFILGITGPIGIVVGAIVAALAVVGVAIYQHWDEIKAFFKDLWNNWLKPGLEKVVGFVKSYFEGLFKFLTAGTTMLVAGIKFIVEEVIPWLENFFSNLGAKISAWGSSTFEKIKAFFAKIVGKLQDFFGNFLDKLESAKGMISNAIHAIGDAMNTAFEFIFGNAWDKIKNLGSTLINVIKDVIGSVSHMFETLKSIFGEILDKLGGAILNIVNLITTGVKSMLDGLKNIFQNTVGAVADILTKITTTIGQGFQKAIEFLENKIVSMWETVKSIPGKFFELGKNIIEKFWNGLQNIWGNVESWFQEHFGWLLEMIDNIIEGVKGIMDSKPVQTVKGWINGSHANGLEYVPYDGYIAELHQGERVLTRSENQQYSSGNGGESGGGDVYNFYNTQSDPYEIARQVRRTKKELAFAQ